MLNVSWNDCAGRCECICNSIIEMNGDNPDFHPAIFGIPKGGVYPALMLQSQFCLKGYRNASLTENVNDATIIIDDLLDSGRTMHEFHERNRNAICVTLYSKSEINDWIVFPWERMTHDDRIETVENNIVRIMQYIGEDVNREGLLETPSRVIRSYDKLYGGYKMRPEDVMKTFEDGACKDMVVLKDIPLYSTCEHHMLPFYGKCHIGYIPNGRVIGVSKLARLMEIYARRLQIQERIGQQITSALEEYLHPLGSACVIEAQHFCMTSRGVEKQTSKMVTSSLTGKFKDIEVRTEFLRLIGL